jgi:hypothetical protein
MKALGAYIFAGGFALGVEKHFDILAHFEMKPGVYKKTFQANFPNVEYYEGEENWPKEKFKNKQKIFVIFFFFCVSFLVKKIFFFKHFGSFCTKI